MANVRLLAIAIVMCADSGMQAGHGSWLPNGLRFRLQETIQNSLGVVKLTSKQQDLIWSCFITLRIIGPVVGAEIARMIVTAKGNQFCLKWTAFLFMVGNTLQYFACLLENIVALFVGRFLQCIGIGMAQVCLSSFITEISPKDVRGRNSSFYNIFIGLGALLTITMALYGPQEYWQEILLLPFVFSLLHFIMTWFLPQSPRFLMEKGESKGEIAASLAFYHNVPVIDADLGSELTHMEAEMTKVTFGKPSMVALLRNRRLRGSVLLLLTVSAARALDGRHVIFSYSVFAVENCGVPTAMTKLMTLVLVFFRFIFAIPLGYLIEKVGRRPLMIGTCYLTLFCFGCLVFSTQAQTHTSVGILMEDHRSIVEAAQGIPWTAYIGLIGTLAWPVAYNFGIGPIPRIVVAESFPQKDRAMAQKISVQFDNLVSSYFTFFYLPMFRFAGGWVYLLIIVPLLPLTIHLTFSMPETKNKEISDILEELNGGY